MNSSKRCRSQFWSAVLSEYEFERLAQYNTDVSRGRVIEPAYAARMGELQARFDKASREDAERHGRVML